MLILAVDTSTPAVTAGVVRLDDTGPQPLATRVTVDARKHAEVLTPHILECLADAGITADDLSAVVVGTGPGPFTGLRVGMATGAAFGDALGVAVEVGVVVGELLGRIELVHRQPARFALEQLDHLAVGRRAHRRAGRRHDVERFVLALLATVVPSSSPIR